MTFTYDAEEVFYHLHGLAQKSDILNLLPMAAYVVRADGVVIWYNARAAELWGRRPAIGDTDERAVLGGESLNARLINEKATRLLFLPGRATSV